VEAPILSDPNTETRLFTIPAPRGLIVDRFGEVLAGNRSEETDGKVIFLRDYPAGESACHVTGYVSPQDPRKMEEPLWPLVSGRSGLEKTRDSDLTGQDGLLSVVYPPDGAPPRKQVVRAPVPGKTLVVSLNAKMQKLADQLLAKGGRPGAFVVMDALTGEVLVLVSRPGFDPNQFVPSISADAFAKLSQDPAQPFFPRAYAGNFPPGSVFKPMVALAALQGGASAYYQCGPSLTIAGREFKNWSKDDYGTFDVRAALMRSCNTWFYQAALDTGGANILSTARAFGIGQKPALELEGVSAGFLPEKETSPHGLANLSIGQGQTLVSPLQMAVAMCGFANGYFLPNPHLVRQVQTAAEHPEVLEAASTEPGSRFQYPAFQTQRVRDGMKAVANDARGTGFAAHLDWPLLFGKTGTAQWSKDGAARTLAWFTGFVEAREPFMAFAIMCEGAPGESISGGKEMAPLAGEFFKTVYGDPDTYRVTVPVRPAYTAPNTVAVRATPITPGESSATLPPVPPGSSVYGPSYSPYPTSPRAPESRGLLRRILGGN